MSTATNTLPKPDAEQPALLFTTAAAQKVQQLIDEENNPALNLRVYITGGGCSGFQYGFTFDTEIKPEDTVITRALPQTGKSEKACEVRLLVDPLSLQYLEGAEIDYTESVAGSQFVIRNPNAQTTCGCGSSFSV